MASKQCQALILSPIRVANILAERKRLYRLTFELLGDFSLTKKEDQKHYCTRWKMMQIIRSDMGTHTSSPRAILLALSSKGIASIWDVINVQVILKYWAPLLGEWGISI